MRKLSLIKSAISKRMDMLIPHPFKARVPIVKIDFRTMMELSHGYLVYISLSNKNGVSNSPLIRSLVHHHDIFSPVVVSPPLVVPVSSSSTFKSKATCFP